MNNINWKNEILSTCLNDDYIEESQSFHTFDEYFNNRYDKDKIKSLLSDDIKCLNESYYNDLDKSLLEFPSLKSEKIISNHTNILETFDNMDDNGFVDPFFYATIVNKIITENYNKRGI